MCKQAEQAREYFKQGFNCAQATVAAFAGVAGTEPGVLLRLGTAFGGGIAGRKETCGAVTGMLMAAGLIGGFDKPSDPSKKEEFAARMRALMNAFEYECGCVDCAGLLERKPDGTERRDYCADLVYLAAELAAEDAGLPE